MSTTTATATLAAPARQMADHALLTVQLGRHRVTVRKWLDALELADTDALFAAVGGDNAAATTLLVTEHQLGNSLATEVLIGAKARMLSAISRQAPGDDIAERFQVTIDAFLTRALAKVTATHRFIDQQLYWITLRTITKLHQARQIDEVELAYDVAGPDVYVDIDSYLTAGIVLDWAQGRGFINVDDRKVLDVRFGGESVLPVREVATRTGVSEDGLESRLRRMMGRLRTGVSTQGADLDRACVDARWDLVPADIRDITETEAVAA